MGSFRKITGKNGKNRISTKSLLFSTKIEDKTHKNSPQSLMISADF